jgi:isopentenyldiphosphate isomerase
VAADDLVDVVDADDRVVGQATRARMRAEGLRHRAVYVVVRTSDDGVVVHRRAGWKDVYPGAWDCCFGGVLDAGEGWEDAAARELAEEAGITAPLRHLGAAPTTTARRP